MGVATGNPNFGLPIVLLIDDDMLFQRSLKRMLTNVEVHLASGAYPAIDMIREGLEPDLVLSDIRMSEGNGVELMEWLSAERPALLDRLLFMTGVGPDEMNAVQPHETLLKPLSEGDIRGVVRRAETNAGV